MNYGRFRVQQLRVTILVYNRSWQKTAAQKNGMTLSDWQPSKMVNKWMT